MRARPTVCLGDRRRRLDRGESFHDHVGHDLRLRDHDHVRALDLGYLRAGSLRLKADQVGARRLVAGGDHGPGGQVLHKSADSKDAVLAMAYKLLDSAPPLESGWFAACSDRGTEGENLGDVEAGSKDSVLGSALVTLKYPGPDGGDPMVEFAIDPAKIRVAFAGELPAEQTAVMAATQRPAAELAFSEASGPPAWRP